MRQIDSVRDLKSSPGGVLGHKVNTRGHCAVCNQLAFRRTSSTASGCFAITASSTRVGASGRARPCSQLRKVAGGKPNLVANCAWLRPILVRTSRTSTSGTWTTVTRTASSSPRVHAMACSSPLMMLAPTVCFFRGRGATFLAFGFDNFFLGISLLISSPDTPPLGSATIAS